MKYDKITLTQDGNSEDELDEGCDEGIGGSSSDEEENVEEDEDMLQSPEHSEESDGDGEDEELFGKPEDLKDTGLNTDFGDDSDDEEDNFDELIAPEGKSSDDEESDDSDAGGRGEADKEKDLTNVTILKRDEKNRKLPDRPGKFTKTEVDTSFFNLRESEWVADNDVIGENYDGDMDAIDMMADVSDGSEGEVGIPQYIM